MAVAVTHYLIAPALRIISPVEVLKMAAGTKVLRRERAKGVDARLLAFLDWWEQNGPFTIMVGVDGGVRTPVDQLRLYSQGRILQAGIWTVVGKTVTKAMSAEDSAHGHAGAVDLWVVLNGRVQLDEKKPEVLRAYKRLGELGEQQGLQWGGRWVDPVDYPHFYVPDWRQLPLVG